MLDVGDRISIYQPEQDGLIFPKLPVFETLEQERQHRKERLVAACRAFASANECSLKSFRLKRACALASYKSGRVVLGVCKLIASRRASSRARQV